MELWHYTCMMKNLILNRRICMFYELNRVYPLVSSVKSDDFLTKEECSELISFFEKNEDSIRNGSFSGEGGSEEFDDDVRKVKIIQLFQLLPTLPETEETENISKIINKIIIGMSELNNQTFDFEINSIDQLELAKYEQGDHYRWHIDCTDDVGHQMRKISFSIKLNDEYESKGLEFKDEYDHNIDENNREVGSVVAFPSFKPHIVNKIESGVRYALFGWVNGPRFK